MKTAVFDEQVSLEQTNTEYAAFVEKFKPKKTTDDCYTPENVFQAVVDWAAKEYGFDPARIVRPFWPGGDYERFDYPEDCVVLDNPPFSILTEICNFYNRHGVRFFLFAPSLTCPIRDFRNCAIISDTDVAYENGAVVRTAFITNMETDYIMRTAPELKQAVKIENDKNEKAGKKELPKYVYPYDVVTCALAQRYAHYGIDYRVRKDEAAFIGTLDAQRSTGKSIFGGGLLLSERAAAERAAATRWTLSDRERAIIKNLGGRRIAA